MIASAAYVAIAVGTWPMFTRYRYGQLGKRHPHTHVRDVYRDAGLALAQGALCAVLWLPIATARCTLFTGWRVARFVLGKAVRADLSAAHTAQLEAELAALDHDLREPAKVLRLDDLRRQAASYSIDLRRAQELRALITEAEQIKAAIAKCEDAGVEQELRAALRTKLDAMHHVADNLSVAQ